MPGVFQAPTLKKLAIPIRVFLTLVPPQVIRSCLLEAWSLTNHLTDPMEQEPELQSVI